MTSDAIAWGLLIAVSAIELGMAVWLAWWVDRERKDV